MPSVKLHMYFIEPCTIMRDICVSFTLREHSGSLLRVSSENGETFGPWFGGRDILGLY